MEPLAQSSGDQGPRAIGIDLGTTYSAVACVDDLGKPYCIPNQDGEMLTPTAILVDEHDIVIGREAVMAAVMEPEAYAECFKRDVGSPVYRRGVNGIHVPPQILSAFVLEQLKSDAERRLGPVTQAVITVPAFFDESRRKATQDAGRMAGLEVLDIINEPTAAALAYGCQHGMLRDAASASQPKRILVYDLGGGTFDVTILEIAGKTFRAIATDGDVQLGGKDFDQRIVEHLAERFIEQHGIDPRTDARDTAQLWMDAQRVKHTLSQRSKTSTVVFHAGVRCNVEITRDQFEQLTRDLLERTETTTSLVVREAGLNWDQIDRVLMVGGSSRMPGVTRMLQQATGREIDCSLSPDEAIAHGAALHAAILTQQNETTLPSIDLINVNSHSLGIRGIDRQTNRKVNAIMIPKNSPLPCKQVKSFTTADADQRSVKVVVLEGESHRPEDCIALGDCVIRDLPPGLPKGTKIEVTYRYASDGRVTVSARIPGTRQSAHVEIQRADEVDLEDLDSWRQRLLSPDDQTQQTSASPQNDGVTSTATKQLSSKQDIGIMLRRLDELYAKVGHAAVRSAVPPALQRTQASAQQTQAAFRAASSTLKKAEEANQDPPTRTDAVRLGSALAKARSKVEQTQTRADFGCMVLGRECVKVGFFPTPVKDLAAEIRQLREQIETV
ncbi:MAG: Hsp70 family protein [Planctomycetota bacterium]